MAPLEVSAGFGLPGHVVSGILRELILLLPRPVLIQKVSERQRLDGEAFVLLQQMPGRIFGAGRIAARLPMRAAGLVELARRIGLGNVQQILVLEPTAACQKQFPAIFLYHRRAHHCHRRGAG